MRLIRIGHPLTVIAIDGPSASGKGSVAQQVAGKLGFHYLDSGAIYRAAALAAARRGVDLDAAASNEAAIAAAAAAMDLRFSASLTLLDGADVGQQIRSEACGADASKIAALPAVRSALLQRQRDFRSSPGLVADGRDMGSVVFPDARLKVFLTAGVEQRARRRAAQLALAAAPPESAAKNPANHPKGLIGKENSGNIHALFENVLADLRARDARDAGRATAPLVRLEEARLLDTSGLSIQQAVQQVLSWYYGL